MSKVNPKTRATWMTNNGQQLEIIWMDSMHLYHSWMMTARNGRHNYALRDELEARGLDPDKVPGLRETPEQLCWVRAILDCDRSYTMKKLALRDFYANPTGWHSKQLSNYGLAAEPIIALAVKYRLTR
jgi:hypothetical protein